MEKKKLKSPEFAAFCRVVSNKLGNSETEVLYAWFYNTFDVKAETDAELKTQTNTNTTDESK